MKEPHPTMTVPVVLYVIVWLINDNNKINNKRLPHEGIALFEMGQVSLVAVHETKVIFTTDEKHGSVGTEATNLWQPHGLAVAQRFRVSDREAQ